MSRAKGTLLFLRRLGVRGSDMASDVITCTEIVFRYLIFTYDIVENFLA